MGFGVYREKFLLEESISGARRRDLTGYPGDSRREESGSRWRMPLIRRMEGNQKCYHQIEGGLCVEKSNLKSHIGRNRYWFPRHCSI